MLQSVFSERQRRLSNYRATCYITAQTSAKDIYEGMNVEANVQQKGLRSTKQHFSYESFDETFESCPEEAGGNIVDAATSALQERFPTLENVGEKFGVVSTFQSLSNEELTEQCLALSMTLHYKEHSDMDGRELAQEWKNLPDLPSKTMTLVELLIFIHERELSEIVLLFQ
jgi:hypothetical protein